MTSNLYKVNDWVYCEVSPYSPYVIRKIEELTKTPCGNVEAKVTCAFRRQDIPQSVMASIEKYQSKNSDKQASNGVDSASSAHQPAKNELVNSLNCDYEESEVSDLSEQQRYNLKHRELYYSKYTDTIAATTIRAKCSVLLFNEEVERYSDYISKEDAFFYHLTYDPYQKSIVADKGEIRVGQRYQSEIPSIKIASNGNNTDDNSDSNAASQSGSELTIKQNNDRVLRSQLLKAAVAAAASSNGSSIIKEQMPEVPIASQLDNPLIWCPLNSRLGFYTNNLTDREIDQFLIIAKSVGTYARALDCVNAFKQPSLALSAASASRDITLFHAMNVLHENNYDICKSTLSLITQSGPVLCKDELEEWSAAEANIFEEALDKYGKEFNEIRRECLPWKSMKSIIEYYYSFKTTDRYVQQKRIKLSEQEAKLKQVYIPNHSKQNQSAIIKSAHVQLFNQYDTHLKPSCESCGLPNTATNQWYAYNLSSLTQLIMSGNHNPAVLTPAAAAQQTAHSNSSSTNGNHIFYQARLCSDCWIYWKKFASFKYSNAKQERLNQLKNQLHKCSVNGCGREFKMKQLLVKHCGIAHGYFAKTNNPPGQNSPRPPAMRNRTSFYLQTTPMTRAARICCTNSIKLKKLARKPFKLVDLSELNKEWTRESRNINDLVKQSQAKTHAKRLLSKDLIAVISKSYSKLLKKKKRSELKKTKSLTNGNSTNGHHTSENHNTQNSNTEDDDDDEDDELVIDNNDDVKGDEPEFLNYFENKSASSCYIPSQLLYPKPSVEQMNKFYLNLLSQNRKRPHESGSLNGDTSCKQANGEINNNSDNSSPVSKRSLTIAGNAQLNNRTTQSLNNNKQNIPVLATAKQSVRMAQKSTKPTQSINLNNAPEEFFYAINNYLKSLRREIKIASLRKLARKPYKILPKYQGIYTKFSEIRLESLAKLEKSSVSSKHNGKETTASEINAKKKLNEFKSDDEIVDVEASDNSNELLTKHKMNGESNEKMVDELATTNDEEVENNNEINSNKPEPVVVLD